MRRLSVSFHGEEGVDAGGVTREWYGVLAREIFNENYALFRSTHDGTCMLTAFVALISSPLECAGVTFQPNPFSAVHKDHLEFFRFVGRFIGKAVCDGHLLDAHFTRYVMLSSDLEKDENVTILFCCSSKVILQAHVGNSGDIPRCRRNES